MSASIPPKSQPILPEALFRKVKVTVHPSGTMSLQIITITNGSDCVLAIEEEPTIEEGWYEEPFPPKLLKIIDDMDYTPHSFKTRPPHLAHVRNFVGSEY